jgi:hypothetical protein
MKIGDLVREYIGGPLLIIVELLDACRIAVCRVLRTGTLQRIAVASLIAAGIGLSTVHGHPPEDPPRPTVIVQPVTPATVGASGAIVGGFGLDQEEPFVPQVQQIPWRQGFFSEDEVLPFPDCSC